MPNHLIIEGPERGVLRITLHRPEALNALNTALLGELAETLTGAQDDPQVRAVVITGSQRAFAAGADIKEMAERDLVGILEDPRQRHWATIARFNKPIVAAVNGFCLGGGCELALACDWAVASDNAIFGQPEVLLGVIPGFGGTQRLPRRVGPAMAIDLCTTGRKIDAAEALRIGLVNRVMPQAELEGYVAELAKQLGGNGPGSVRAAKQAIHDGMDQDLDSALALENALFAFCFAGDEQTEGMSAFVEKRKPNF